MIETFVGVLAALVVYHHGGRLVARALRWYGAIGAYDGFRARTPWPIRSQRAHAWAYRLGVKP